jgi:hypothetical protein
VERGGERERRGRKGVGGERRVSAGAGSRVSGACLFFSSNAREKTRSKAHRIDSVTSSGYTAGTAASRAALTVAALAAMYAPKSNWDEEFDAGAAEDADGAADVEAAAAGSAAGGGARGGRRGCCCVCGCVGEREVRGREQARACVPGSKF